jgi:hypothetical protein
MIVGGRIMPLRDHFRPPVINKQQWNALHAMWPAMLVQELFDILPPGYQAAPSVHMGQLFEIDVSTYEVSKASRFQPVNEGNGDGGIALAAPPEPTLTLETDLLEQDEFEVRVYDTEFGRQLVAAIEIVSPSNKDRPKNHRAFAAKVSALLQKEVCVSVIDLVTIRQFSLYAEVLESIGESDPKLSSDPASLYAYTIRSKKRPENKFGKKRSLLDFWYYPMNLGEALPTLTIWLKSDLHIKLSLERSYEQTCRLLHIA